MKKSNRGFTLVELMVVLVIMAILAIVLIPSFTGYIDRAKLREVVVEARLAVTSAQTLYSEARIFGNDVDYDDIKEFAEVSGEVTSVEVTKGTVMHLTYVRDKYTVTFCRRYADCTDHDEMYNLSDSSGADDGDGDGGGVSVPTYPGTDAPLQTNPWPESSGGSATISPSGIFEYAGNYYVIPWDVTLGEWAIANWNPELINNWGRGNGSVKLSGKTINWNGTDSLVGTDYGDVVEFNGSYYVYTNHQNGAGVTPENSADWYKVP